MTFSKLRLVLAIFFALLTASTGICETFSFAIICDPHVDGTPSHKTGLEEAVNWIAANRQKKDIRFVFVLGDIAWGSSEGKKNILTARKILDKLNTASIPYIPMPGDNEIEYGAQKDFNDIFADQYKHLQGICENWQKSPVRLNNMYLQNFSFDYKDCHFVCPDFVSRKTQKSGDIIDVNDGSWNWFKNDIKTCPKTKLKNTVIFTHIGMFRTGIFFADENLFSNSDLSKIKEFLTDYRDHIDSNYAGHIHKNLDWQVRGDSYNPLYTVRMTANLTNTHKIIIRCVSVDTSDPKISYNQKIETIDIPASVK